MLTIVLVASYHYILRELFLFVFDTFFKAGTYGMILPFFS